MVTIIADSTCDLSPELIKRYGVEIIPLQILLGDDAFEDGAGVTPDEIYRWADANSATPKTAAPSLETVATVMGRVLESGNDAVCLTISESMSTCANVLRLAARELGAENRVKVINSENLSTGIGLMVLSAAEMAQKGASAQEIADHLERLKPRIRASFVVDTLTYLHRGGRCSGVAAMAGGLLRLHPMISVSGGKMSPGKKYRGKMKRVIGEYVEELTPALKKADAHRVFITHSGCEESVIAAVKDMVSSMGHFEEICITRAGGVISSHCGPGTLGVLFVAGE